MCVRPGVAAAVASFLGPQPAAASDDEKIAILCRCECLLWACCHRSSKCVTQYDSPWTKHSHRRHSVIHLAWFGRRAAWNHSSGVNFKRKLYVKDAEAEQAKAAERQALLPLWKCLEGPVHQFAQAYIERVFRR